MFETLRLLFAVLGAALILFALTYVTLLVGALVNVMAVLIAGPVVDRVLGDRDAEPS